LIAKLLLTSKSLNSIILCLVLCHIFSSPLWNFM